MNRKDRRTEIVPVLEAIRTMIRRSDLSQRMVEKQAGFSKGYLSQLLAHNLDLKVWHILAILDVFDVQPADFFEDVFPRPKRMTLGGQALEEFIHGAEPLPEDIETSINQLYRLGVDSLTELRMRLGRCEKAVDQLEARGIVHLHGIDFGHGLEE
ncbi:MAG: helix-turn-helix domain-containing protein [Thermoanaerobaculia bacterium]|nr:helix-turn-helix domain-containing protein [Thermoanaerobaculia bacterium]